MTTTNEWYMIADIDQMDSPSLVIYRDRVLSNIRLAIDMAGGARRLRPHVKTHKSSEAGRLMLEEGITKFKCATIAEAEMLGLINAPDVLLAYQPVGPKLDRFISLIKYYPKTRYSCLVDSIQTAQAIAKAALLNNVEIPVFIDLNAGMNRTGVAPGDAAIQLYEQCAALNGIKVAGLHVYDGHIHNEDAEARKKECLDAFAAVEKMQAELVRKGFTNPVIVAGGSPTFPIHATNKNVECSPGTFIYWDAGYQEKLKEQKFQPAALVVTRIISLPTDTKLCIDLGHKSIAAENDLAHRIVFVNAAELKPVSQSEEHMVLQAPEGHHYKTGDVLYGLPYHICPTCALFERAMIIEDHQIVDEWRMIARNRTIVH